MKKETLKLITSEAVSEGHPDKLADQISDTLLDAHLEQDRNARVACETLISGALVVIAGEITSNAHINAVDIATKVLHKVGYTEAFGCNPDTCTVIQHLTTQSADITLGVNAKEQGAGDQGMMIGYACQDTEQLMPLPVTLAQQLIQQLTMLRHQGIAFLGPDAKAQVTVAYDNFTPIRVETVVISTQHTTDITQLELHEFLQQEVVNAVIPLKWRTEETVYHFNPTGRFVIGGPVCDCGVTGRKIIADTYGGICAHGGGAFSGKDPSKVDRSAAYAARYAAKHIVAAKLARVCEVHLAYAIGVAEPVSIRVETFNTSAHSNAKLEKLLRDTFDFRPAAFIQYLNLLQPIYSRTSTGGHFGNADFPWEKLDRLEELLEKCK